MEFITYNASDSLDTIRKACKGTGVSTRIPGSQTKRTKVQLIEAIEIHNSQFVKKAAPKKAAPKKAAPKKAASKKAAPKRSYSAPDHLLPAEFRSDSTYTDDDFLADHNLKKRELLGGYAGKIKDVKSIQKIHRIAASFIYGFDFTADDHSFIVDPFRFEKDAIIGGSCLGLVSTDFANSKDWGDLLYINFVLKAGSINMRNLDDYAIYPASVPEVFLRLAYRVSSGDPIATYANFCAIMDHFGLEIIKPSELSKYIIKNPAFNSRDIVAGIEANIDVIGGFYYARYQAGYGVLTLPAAVEKPIAPVDISDDFIGPLWAVPVALNDTPIGPVWNFSPVVRTVTKARGKKAAKPSQNAPKQTKVPEHVETPVSTSEAVMGYLDGACFALAVGYPTVGHYKTVYRNLGLNQCQASKPSKAKIAKLESCFGCSIDDISKLWKAKQLPESWVSIYRDNFRK